MNAVLMHTHYVQLSPWLAVVTVNYFMPPSNKLCSHMLFTKRSNFLLFSIRHMFLKKRPLYLS